MGFSMTAESISGQITRTDLTVADVEPIRKFHESVVGWKSSPVEMGQYSDYSMTGAAGNVVAGVCHARGENASVPPCWLSASHRRLRVAARLRAAARLFRASARTGNDIARSSSLRGLKQPTS